MTIRIEPPRHTGGASRVIMTAALPVGEISENRNGRLEMHFHAIADQLSHHDHKLLSETMRVEVDRMNALHLVTKRLMT